MSYGLLFLRATLIFYSLGFGAALLPFLTEGRRRLGGWASILAGAGVFCHSLGLIALGLEEGRCPLATLPEILSALAWASVLIGLLASWRYRFAVLQVISLPLAVVVLCLAKILPVEMIPVSESLRPSLLRFHLTAIILGVAALFVTFAASLVYLIVDRALKAKRPTQSFAALPSLERSDRVGLLSLLWAFPLLTVGIVSGAVMNETLTGTPWTWQPRETLAILAWVLLGAVVVARLGWGWRGRKAALLTIVAFALVFLRMIGV